MRNRVTAMFVVGLLLAACGGGAAEDAEGTESVGEDAAAEGSDEPTSLSMAITSAPQGGWDPTAWTWDGYTPVIEAAYDGLLRSTSEGIEPGLAEDWGWESLTEFWLTIREGVTFENGEELTAEVVRDNLERFTESTNRVVGRLAAIEEIEATSDTEVRLHLSAPIPDLELLLTENAGLMVSPGALDDPDILASEPSGISPFLLDEGNTVADVTYVFTKNPDFWDADSVTIDELTIEIQEDPSSSFNALRADQLDLIWGAASDIEAAESAGIEVAPRPGTMLVMTVNDYQGKQVEALGDERVRQAMNYAVDREAIASVVMGEPAGQMFPPESEAYSEDLTDAYSYDPDRARELLEEAGYGDGLELTLHAITPTATAASAVTSYFDEVGIELDVNTLPVQEFLSEVLAGNATLILTTNVVGTAFADLSAMFDVPGGRNPLENEHPEAQDLLREAQYEEDEEARADLYQQISQIISDEAITVPIAQEDRFFMHNENVDQVNLPDNYIMPTVRELVN